ncbi:response regulator, partial [bacterium]
MVVGPSRRGGFASNQTRGPRMSDQPANPDTTPAAAGGHESFLPDSKVLIVDDNPQNVELLTAFLETLPIQLSTATDGIEALEAVEAGHPDLILL